jgi:hypothetical protein
MQSMLLLMIAAAPPASHTIVDLFLQAPPAVVSESAERRAAITVSDVKNGYLEARWQPTDAASSEYVVVLWESTRGPLVGVSHAEADHYDVRFYLSADGWRDVTAEVFPVTMHQIALAYRAKKLGEIDEESGYATPIWKAALPRKGTSIRIIATSEQLPLHADPTLMTLSFDRTKFVIDTAVAKAP